MSGDRTCLDPAIFGYAMSAFFGGRAEARVVRTPVPVVLVDANGMYPLVNANLGTWRLLTARSIRTRDVTRQVRRLLARPDLFDVCFERAFWRDSIGVTLVELDRIDGAVLPVRAPFDANALDPGIGVEPLRYTGRLWYMLPDVITAAVLTRAAPDVRRALRLLPVGIQPGLRAVRLRGGRTIDPLKDDPFVAMAEERARVRADASLPAVERDRVQLFLKITNNASTYGVLARFDRRELAKETDVLVYGPDAGPLRRRLATVEDPGPYTFPPVAASITAGARLMLALLERLVVDAGGTYAFVDTDSMAIVASPAGTSAPISAIVPARALSFAEVRVILSRFSHLDPYDASILPEVWKVEHDSLARPLWCYAISAKRYALFRLSSEGRPSLVHASDDEDTHDTEAPAGELADWSEHGLGLYLSPLLDERGRALRDGEGRLVWIRQAWEWVIARALGQHPPLPVWADAFAVTRFSVSSPKIAEWFRGRDEKLPAAERMRPGSFGLIAHPDPLTRHFSDAQPAAPFETDPVKWPSLAWYDRKTARRLTLTRRDSGMSADRLAHQFARGDVVIARTLGDVLLGYERRPEHKSLAPDGSPATGTTAGLLLRRPVTSLPSRTRLSGKEGNKLVERITGVITEARDYRSDYGTRTDPWAVALPVLRDLGVPQTARRTSLPERSVRRALSASSGARPKEGAVEKLMSLAARHAQARLGELGIRPDEDDALVVQRYAELLAQKGARRCACGCDRPTPGRSKWASEACRKRTARRG